MVERINSDLANTLGNLVNRTISMTNKYFGGKVTDKGVVGEVDADLKAVVDGTPAAVDKKMADLRVADAITEIFNLFKRCNKYIDETMPWVLAKDEAQKDRLETVLFNLIDSIEKGAKLLASFLPETAERILKQTNGGNVTEKPEILFARLDAVKVMEEVNAMIESRKEKVIEEKTEPKKEPIDIEDFAKIELKIAKVIACEKVEKSKKLLKLTVKIGEETRTVVSGIALHYSPEQMIGKKLTMITNLKPAKLCGIVSEGMILCAENSEGKLAFLMPENDIEDGSQIF